MNPKKLVIQWPRLGPLHLNRLHAAHRVLGSAGIEVVALEIASASDAYAWRVEEGSTPFERITVFPRRNYDSISPRQMHAEVTAALTRLNPDAVHIHSYSTPDARACLAWCRKNNRVAICMAESKRDDAERSRLREYVKRLLVSQFDAAQAAGSLATEYIVDLGIEARRVCTGYSVVDNEYFASRADEVRADKSLAAQFPELQDQTPYFFASARFMERKNLLTLLKAYYEYRHRSSAPWRLILLGDGELRPELEAFISERQIEGVHMPGWRQIEDLPIYYGLAATFVHTATVDQWGLVINEAMAAGLPVIASTGAGATHDLVKDGENGFQFDPMDVPTLTAHMYAIAHEVDRDAFARRSREIIDQWPLERFGTSLLAALESGAEGDLDRGLDPRVQALIWLMQATAQHPRAFHAIQD